MSSKLHEVLAVESARRGAYGVAVGDTENIFGRPELFMEGIRSYEPFADEEKNEAGVQERQAMTTTVGKCLDNLGEFFVAYIDVVWQKESTNVLARGTITLDDLVIENVPVSFLLHMEKTLTELRRVIKQLPVLQVGVDWEPDTDHEFSGVMKAVHAQETNRTRKTLVPFELSPATKEHRAQVKELTEDKVIGRFSKELWSGMYTASKRATVLKRVDELLEATRTARMRANEEKVEQSKIAAKMWGWLFS